MFTGAKDNATGEQFCMFYPDLAVLLHTSTLYKNSLPQNGSRKFLEEKKKSRHLSMKL